MGISDYIQTRLCFYIFDYDLGQKYNAPQVRPNWGLNSWPSDHDSAFHVTEMPALTIWPSVTSNRHIYVYVYSLLSDQSNP